MPVDTCGGPSGPLSSLVMCSSVTAAFPGEGAGGGTCPEGQAKIILSLYMRLFCPEPLEIKTMLSGLADS